MINMKNASKYLLLVLLTVPAYYFISAGIVGYEALALKGEVKTLIHDIHAGVSVSSQSGLLTRMDRNIGGLNSTLTNPFWRPITNLFLKDSQNEIMLLQQVVKVSPSILGSQSPKKYLLVFQNSAESRGTGGLVGAYAEIQAYRGAISVIKQGSNLDLKSLNAIPIAMPTEFNDLYGSDPAMWVNSNESPHFPYAARIWSALWQKQFNEKLDGVIATDPEALSYVLKAIGPVVLASGEVIDSTNVVSKTLSDAYQRFGADYIGRKQYLVAVMKSVMNKLVAGNFSKIKFMQMLQTPLLDHRILLNLADPVSQSVIAPTVISGVLSNSPNNEYRVVLINTSGNKLDYYLRKVVKIESTSCKRPATTEITTTITNVLSSTKGLADDVVGRLDLKLPHGAKGRNGFLVLIYGPTGAAATSVLRSDPNQVEPQIASERGRPIAFFRTDLAEGASETYTVDFSGGTGPITYVKQPLVAPEVVSIHDGCS